LDLSNPAELNRKIFRMLDKVGCVFLELLEGLRHLDKLVAFHDLSVASEMGDIRLDFDQPLIQSKTLITRGHAGAS
jgi:hypothetical protein